MTGPLSAKAFAILAKGARALCTKPIASDGIKYDAYRGHGGWEFIVTEHRVGGRKYEQHCKTEQRIPFAQMLKGGDTPDLTQIPVGISFSAPTKGEVILHDGTKHPTTAVVAVGVHLHNLLPDSCSGITAYSDKTGALRTIDPAKMNPEAQPEGRSIQDNMLLGKAYCHLVKLAHGHTPESDTTSESILQSKGFLDTDGTIPSIVKAVVKNSTTIGTDGIIVSRPPYPLPFAPAEAKGLGR